MISLRDALDEDIPWILDEVEVFAERHGSEQHLEVGVEYGTKYIKNLIKHHYFKVAVKNGVEKAGFIAGLITPHHFNPELTIMHELLWWVSDKYRGQGAGIMMLDAYLKYGKEHCNLISFTLQDIGAPNDKVLTDRGLKLKERSYLMEVKK